MGGGEVVRWLKVSGGYLRARLSRPLTRHRRICDPRFVSWGFPPDPRQEGSASLHSPSGMLRAGLGTTVWRGFPAHVLRVPQDEREKFALRSATRHPSVVGLVLGMTVGSVAVSAAHGPLRLRRTFGKLTTNGGEGDSSRTGLLGGFETRPYELVGERRLSGVG